MSRPIIEFLRVVRYAINRWQRTFCLVIVVVFIAAPVVACATYGNSTKLSDCRRVA